MSVNVRRSSAVHPKDFEHPYLAAKPALPKKREFGLCNIFLFKVCGCFSADDDLPPPNYEAPVYQAGAKSTSSNLTFKTTTTTTRTTSPTDSPAKDLPQSPTQSPTVAASPSSRDLVGATGVENIPYRRPPPDAPKPRVQPVPHALHSPTLRKSSIPNKPMSTHTSEDVALQELQEHTHWQNRVPDILAEVDEEEPPRSLGNVSRLSAMFGS